MEQSIFSDLSLRLGEEMLSKRLTQQVKYAASLYCKGSYSSLHLENFQPIFTVLKFILKVCGQYRRAQENTLDYRCEENQLQGDNINMGLKGFRVLQLSDLHLDGIKDKGRKLNRLVRETEAEMLVITGDFRFHDYGDYYMISKLYKEFMEGFMFPYGIYGILGNHDFIETVPIIEDLGIKLLINEYEIIPVNGTKLWLAGIDDAHFYGCHDIPKIPVDKLSPEFRILLSHTPETYKEAEEEGYNLQLSGHTHGGQVCLPGRIPIMTNAACPKKLCSGAWSHKKMQGYTSRGAGASGLGVRLFCPPEITLHQFV